MQKHMGVKSWFQEILDVSNDFVSDEWIVWVDIEETLDLEDNVDNSFGRKRICIKTKHQVSILESFKVIVKGRVYMIRAKELFTWNPSFLAYKEKEYASEDESVRDSNNNEEGQIPPNDEVFEDEPISDDNGVPETVFESSTSPQKQANGDNEDSHLEDPFGFYALLKEKKMTLVIWRVHATPAGINTNVVNSPGDASVASFSEQVGHQFNNTGGSVLEIMEGFIKVGQAMGYTMDGCLGHKTKKEWIKALTNSFKLNFLAIQETKMSSVSYMVVKSLWGNSNYDFACSDSLGCSGVVYAPQLSSGKKNLWDYLLTIFGRWNGLIDIPLEGYAFTWSHPLASKMSKLDRFLISDGVFSLFSSITAVCLDRHLSDHRPILLWEVYVDFGPIPF
nr:hypothetical protein [Tanacetum cinerariifolium]